MAQQQITSFTAGRRIVLNGVTYQPGDEVPNAEVKDVPHLSALISNGSLVPDKDPHHRRTKKGTPTPVTLNPKQRAAL